MPRFFSIAGNETVPELEICEFAGIRKSGKKVAAAFVTNTPDNCRAHVLETCFINCTLLQDDAASACVEKHMKLGAIADLELETDSPRMCGVVHQKNEMKCGFLGPAFCFEERFVFDGITYCLIAVIVFLIVGVEPRMSAGECGQQLLAAIGGHIGQVRLHD
jgi:hypothetical protein